MTPKGWKDLYIRGWEKSNCRQGTTKDPWWENRDALRMVKSRAIPTRTKGD